MSTAVDTQPVLAVLLAPPASLTEAFHRINSLIPEDQELVKIRPTTTVAEATQIMRERRFSQLPVVEGREVLGVFSYRSLTEHLLAMGSVPKDWASFPVDDFLEEIPCLDVWGELEETFPHLERWDAVLIGQRDRLQGIVTPMNALQHTYDTAIPFIQLGEIELTVRRLILGCVDEEGLRPCMENSLPDTPEEELPTSLEDMDFNHYVQIIGDGRNWKLFADAFGGPGDWHRKRVRTKLEEVRDLRNDVFHFKRELTDQDRATLSNHRDWLLRRARYLGARRGEQEGGRAS